MVGSIVDPAADDGLGLTGPGAPGAQKDRGVEEHPIRARLLEKAREAGRTLDEGVTSAPALDAPNAPRLEVEASPTLSVANIPYLDEPTPPAVAQPEPILVPSVELPPPPEERPSVPPPTPHPGAVASELDRIARRSAPTPAGPGLSPNMIALIGGLLGLSVITSLGLFLSKTEMKPIALLPQEKEVEAPVEEKPEPKVERPKRKKVEGPWRIADDATKAGHRVLSGKIGKQAFLTAIQEAGLPKSEAYRAYGALKSELDLDHCKSSDTFMALVKGSDKALIAFEYVISKEEVYQVKQGNDGKLSAAKLDLKVERNQIRRAFIHDGKSFEESARRAGFDPGISSIAADALRGHAALDEFKRGDRIRVIAQEVTVLGEFARYSGLEAMEILRAGEEPRRIYYYPHPVEGGHFDQNSKAPYEGGWRKPIPDAPRTSPFNPKRMHPTLKRVMPHNGTDFGCATGTPIGATSPGTISFHGQGGGYGNLIRIKHGGGYESGYAHLSRFESGLKIGDKVERMQTIGYCGSTGRSTGPHLHFEIKKDGVFIDAETLNLDGLRVLPKSHREEFAAVRAKYDPVLSEIPLPDPLPVEAKAASEAAVAAPEPTRDDEETSTDTSASNGMVADESPAQAAAPKVAAAAPPSDPAKAQAPSAIFLSDAELLKMQSLNDDGEVNE